MGYARIPNGTGNFVIQAPTFNANNESLGIKQYSANDIKFFPNPVDTMLNINAPFLIDDVKVFSSLGQLLLSEKYNLNNISLDLSSLEQGVYLMKINNTFSKIILKK